MTKHINVISLAVSIDTVAVITECSKRTWQRRIANGTVRKLPDDLRGRSMLSLHEVKSSICIQMSEDDLLSLLQADSGDASSQNDMGQKFFIAKKYETAIFWFNQAASKGSADAMQWLGISYASGKGVIKDENIALMWIAKSASLGHPISTRQIKDLVYKPDDQENI